MVTYGCQISMIFVNSYFKLVLFSKGKDTIYMYILIYICFEYKLNSLIHSTNIINEIKKKIKKKN